MLAQESVLRQYPVLGIREILLLRKMTNVPFLFNFNLFSIYVHAYVSICLYVRLSPGTEVTVSWEPPDISTENQTGIHCKSTC